jgi:hydrogenase maturation protein HypF
MAEHGLSSPVIGVVFDGAGYGSDGAIWGGEFLLGDYRTFRRAGHLRYVGMPGGEQAVREPWRMAAAHLIDAEAECDMLFDRLPPHEVTMIRTMLQRGINCPRTSSAGRLFDAVAALAGVRGRVSYEGQAAMELEWRAHGAVDAPYPFEISEDTTGGSAAPMFTIDTRPLIRAVAADAYNGIEPRAIARRFHATMADLIVAACQLIHESTRLDAVVLSGGVFMNALLSHEAAARLTAVRFRVFRHRLVPPNDGGLSLGQIAIAAETES